MGERLVRIVERAPERCGNDAGKIPVDAQTMRGDRDVYVALSADPEVLRYLGTAGQPLTRRRPRNALPQALKNGPLDSADRHIVA